MLAIDSDTPIETYSSYKKKKFHKYKEKARMLINGIGCLSLKPKDKEKLKREILETIKQIN